MAWWLQRDSQMQRALRDTPCHPWLVLASLLCHLLCCYGTVGPLGATMRPAGPARVPTVVCHTQRESSGGMHGDAFSLAWGFFSGDGSDGYAPREEGGEDKEEDVLVPEGRAPAVECVLTLIWSLPLFLLFLLLPYMCGHGTGPSWLFRVVLAWALAWTCACTALAVLAGLPHLAWCVAMHSFSVGCTAVRGVVQGRGWSPVDVQSHGAWTCPGSLLAALHVSCLLTISCMRGSSISAYDEKTFYSNHLVAYLAVQLLRNKLWLLVGTMSSGPAAFAMPRDD